MADLASLLRVSAGSVLIRTPYLCLDAGAPGVYLPDETLQMLGSAAAQRDADGDGSFVPPAAFPARRPYLPFRGNDGQRQLAPKLNLGEGFC